MRIIKGTPKETMREVKREAKRLEAFRGSEYFDPNKEVQSDLVHPYNAYNSSYGNLKTADGRWGREVDCTTLRRVASKAWVINLCITNIQKKIKPFLKPSTNRNARGFVVHKVGEDLMAAAGKQNKEREAIEAFLRNCGDEADSDRDGFVRYCTKIVRDILEIDQVATEICYRRDGRPYAFLAVDAGTIEKVLPGQDNPYNIKFVQVIDGMARAYYPEGAMVFDYQNPRTDIYHSQYGYSYVAQAVDLITSSIMAFAYNSSYFVENKLPRGMLLLDGNASQETVEEMEDYIYDVMSGNTANQWRIPIIPAGGGSGENNSIKWVSLNTSNKDMEFQSWLDFLTSAVVAIFGCSMEELGLHSSKSQPMFEHNDAPKIEASKSIVLGDTLSFLQSYLNRIITIVFPGYELEFVGYERDDPKAVLDITKGELESFKTLNEVRKEKGLPPIDADWASMCPANPQFTQMYQAAQGGGGDGADEVDDDTDDADDEVDEGKWGGVGKAFGVHRVIEV